MTWYDIIVDVLELTEQSLEFDVTIINPNPSLFFLNVETSIVSSKEKYSKTYVHYEQLSNFFSALNVTPWLVVSRADNYVKKESIWTM